MDLHLRGHRSLITGAASGIGLETARHFAEEGCSLLLWDISDKVSGVADELRQLGVQVDADVVDVEDLDQVQAQFTQRVGSGETIDHLVHCAATGSGCYGFPFTNLKPEDWKRTLAINILGTVNVAHTVTPHMIQRSRGTMVFLASVAGQIGSQTDPAYSASKAANINFAQCMAKDLAPHGIRVNTVCPGMVETPLNRSVWKAWYDRVPEAQRLSYESWAEEKIRRMVPLGRWQSCGDVAAMIVFLSSDRTREVTGQTINVDGGFVMHW